MNGLIAAIMLVGLFFSGRFFAHVLFAASTLVRHSPKNADRMANRITIDLIVSGLSWSIMWFMLHCKP